MRLFCWNIFLKRVKKILKWKPLLTLEEGILETVNWYKAFYSKEDMNQFSLKQIANFIK